MCGSIRSLVCWSTFIVSIIAFVAFVAVTYDPASTAPPLPPYFQNEDSWGGTTIATGKLLPDRASAQIVTGVVLFRESPTMGRYLRFENIKSEGIQGDESAIILILTGAPFPTDVNQRKLQAIELDGTPQGFFLKTGSFNQQMPDGVKFKGFLGAILWDVKDMVMVSNISFE